MKDPAIRPLIGMSTYAEVVAWGVWRQHSVLLPSEYPRGISRAGGVPVLLPPVGERAADAAAAIAALDGLVLTGGPDVDPARYGAVPHEATEEPQPERDAWELALLHAAIAADVPVLGICRGMQLMNVGLGGTLRQHLPETVGHDEHLRVPGTFSGVTADLLTDALPGSVLGGHVAVSCHHHQAVDTLGDGLVATGWAPDGTVESMALSDHRFGLAVQWHPEVGEDPRLFAALVTAAVARRAG